MNRQSIARPPTRAESFRNRSFRWLTYCFAFLTILLVLFVVFEIGWASSPAMEKYGFGFITGRTWDPNTGEFSILPEIWGTLYSSLFALLLGTVFGVAIAIFLSEHFFANFVYGVIKLFGLQHRAFWGRLPERLEATLTSLIELLAAIPSVVYGLWGIFILIPLIRPWCNWIHDHLGWIPIFGTNLSGPGMLPASLVLAIMILPTITAISRDALVAVPRKLRDAAYGLGATRWEAIFGVILPTASAGVFGAIVLAFGRALGETMALAMLIGNANEISWSLFSPANTLAALLANNFGEAGDREKAVLMYAALVLLAITLIVNIFGAMILQRAQAGQRGLR
ncbi:MAG: phosphate ABC transporter permease subunit PstC [Planctomycetota bacterium]